MANEQQLPLRIEAGGGREKEVLIEWVSTLLQLNENSSNTVPYVSVLSVRGQPAAVFSLQNYRLTRAPAQTSAKGTSINDVTLERGEGVQDGVMMCDVGRWGRGG